MAFNAEIAHIGEAVSEEMMGLIRYTWWREAIDEIYAGKPPRKHPVVEALQPVIQRYRLTREYFDQLIAAREQDLDNHPFATMEELEHYAAATSFPLLALWLEILGIKDEASIKAIEHLGVAWAMVGILRAIPFRAQQGKSFLPADLQRDIPLRDSAELRKTVLSVLGRAMGHLQEFKKSRYVFRGYGLPLLQLVTFAHRYIQRIRSCGGNVYGHSVHRPHFILYFQLFWNSVVK